MQNFADLLGYVGGGLDVVVPDGGEDLLPGEDLPAVAHKVLQQGVRPAGELYPLVAAPGVARDRRQNFHTSSSASTGWPESRSQEAASATR